MRHKVGFFPLQSGILSTTKWDSFHFVTVEAGVMSYDLVAWAERFFSVLATSHDFYTTTLLLRQTHLLF